ncbi:hotdog domain-containing protein [Salinibacterium sp. G-O1]|uniref:acyl-CoA thioesterase n=1 Tax=Salinibacterium sp. G-O1 TaxID=3046208 RepID=UPI0024B8E0E6|nr:thioesterase family protein [Salinibacterium sp. G-O1]MDJ0335557.1 hotdog domain-containing protein [Salinibacterium sp. G-O1]
MDAYGHINNVVILRLVEEARVRVIWRSEDPAENLPTAVLDPAVGVVMTVVARLETEYLAQMPYSRAPAELEVWFGAIGGASFDMCYEVYSPIGVEPRVLYARCVVTMVTVTAADGRPTRLPDTCRDAWADYTEDPVIFTRRSRA